MSIHKVVVVHLRRPQGKKDKRCDPFWEYGIFGIRSVIRKTYSTPGKVGMLQAVRLAFAQGSDLGMRLVFLSPPIWIERHEDCRVARWNKGLRPFRYSRALILIANGGCNRLL